MLFTKGQIREAAIRTLTFEVEFTNVEKRTGGHRGWDLEKLEIEWGWREPKEGGVERQKAFKAAHEKDVLSYFERLVCSANDRSLLVANAVEKAVKAGKTSRNNDGYVGIYNRVYARLIGQLMKELGLGPEFDTAYGKAKSESLSAA